MMVKNHSLDGGRKAPVDTFWKRLAGLSFALNVTLLAVTGSFWSLAAWLSGPNLETQENRKQGQSPQAQTEYYGVEDNGVICRDLSVPSVARDK